MNDLLILTSANTLSISRIKEVLDLNQWITLLTDATFWFEFFFDFISLGIIIGLILVLPVMFWRFFAKLLF